MEDLPQISRRFRLPRPPALASILARQATPSRKLRRARPVRFPTLPFLAHRRMPKTKPTVLGLPASEPEVAVAQVLTRLGIPFEFQVTLLSPARKLRGTAVVDFLITDRQPPLVIRVQGVYWHGQTAVKRLADLEQREALEEAGYEVVDVWEDAIRADAETVVMNALAGLETPA